MPYCRKTYHKTSWVKPLPSRFHEALGFENSTCDKSVVRLGLQLASPATEVPNPHTPRSAREGAWGSAGRKWGARERAPESAWEGAWEGARQSACPPLLAQEKGGQALSRAPSQAPSRALSGALSRAPHFRPALPQAPPRALFGVCGFGTSVAGKANRKTGNHPWTDANH